tara:strand:- start:18953 stop:19693 length:741 start_codon:yes stop_codon:yes gene_type:complete
MKNLYVFLAIVLLVSCKESVKKVLDADEIVNKAIEVCGGDLYEFSVISFKFRDKEYISENRGTILKRIFKSDSLNYIDIKTNTDFQRYIDDTPVSVSDSVAALYSNSVNSVHYFAQLPYRLNDKAVHKELIKEQIIANKSYYLVKVTFDKNGGGNDFDDTYLYWLNKETFKPDYLAYDFHTDGGGLRFREAYNERYVEGIRFVDYKNYKPKDSLATLEQVADLFIKNQLELLSEINLENITVKRTN